MKFLIILINTLVIFLFSDYLYSNFKKAKSNSTISMNKNYGYDFIPNLDTIDKYGHLNFRLCTDINSFRINCKTKEKNRNFKKIDFLFLGDSFVEGIGLNHKDTFVGRLQNQYPSLNIINSGIRGYGSINYLNKFKYLVKKDKKIEKAIIFIDISDLEDKYDQTNKKSESVNLNNKEIVKVKQNIREKIKKNFNYTYYIYFNFRQLLEKNFFIKNERFKITLKNRILAYKKNYKRASWTYVSESILNKNSLVDKVKADLKEIFDLCKINNIQCSIAVYPWPNQILYDKKESKHVKYWENFCLRNECEKFINLFPLFFEKENNINNFDIIIQNYIYKDVHFNENGNRLIYEELTRVFKNEF